MAKRVSVSGLQQGESLFVDGDVFGASPAAAVAVASEPVQQPPLAAQAEVAVPVMELCVGVLVLTLGKAPAGTLEDLLPPEPAREDSGKIHAAFARQVREALSSSRAVSEFPVQVEQHYFHYANLLENWAHLDGPDQALMQTEFAEFSVAWVEFILASDLPHLRFKCM